MTSHRSSAARGRACAPHRGRLVACALASALLAAAAPAAPPDAAATPAPSALPAPGLEGASFERWRAHILPDEDELRWMAIEWRPSFWQAVVDAHRQRRPIVLWAMNGHPMACT